MREANTLMDSLSSAAASPFLARTFLHPFSISPSSSNPVTPAAAQWGRGAVSNQPTLTPLPSPPLLPQLKLCPSCTNKGEVLRPHSTQQRVSQQTEQRNPFSSDSVFFSASEFKDKNQGDSD